MYSQSDFEAMISETPEANAPEGKAHALMIVESIAQMNENVIQQTHPSVILAKTGVVRLLERGSDAREASRRMLTRSQSKARKRSPST